ncbi:hypothetical protein LDO26_07365 [Luteimonas sp. BDR2-5]|uniref:hypothetical protein n=1 Tax=Proluteimonas luteida TaxID=2878685 RepID=UPI001E599C0E|nr:hypothetical protein [Luteimonas sp. BDR2-5]MCD9028025.1 hypothetical protein [Luteimonas sp. BDR2-5]
MSPATLCVATQASPAVQPCRAVLQALVASASGILGAVVATVDGRAFADAGHANHEFDPARVAAISSSLLALSESFSRETLQCQAQHTSIATARGAIVVVRVPSRTRAHALCLWADSSENFAMTLRFALDTAARVAEVLDAA